jgi:hypothetical protein
MKWLLVETPDRGVVLEHQLNEAADAVHVEPANAQSFKQHVARNLPPLIGETETDAVLTAKLEEPTARNGGRARKSCCSVGRHFECRREVRHFAFLRHETKVLQRNAAFHGAAEAAETQEQVAAHGWRHVAAAKLPARADCAFFAQRGTARRFREVRPCESARAVQPFQLCRCRRSPVRVPKKTLGEIAP